MLQSAEDADTPLTIQLKKLTSQILFIAGAAVALSIILNLSRGESFDTVFTAAIAFAISAIPTGPARGRHDDPLVRHAAAREGERDHEAAPLDRDARLDVGDQLRQDRDADAQPDDGGRADDPGPPLHDLRRRLLDGGDDQARLRPGRRCRSSSSCCRWRSAPTRSSRTATSIGDPTEGALVVLAEKGGLDVGRDAAGSTRASPSCRSTPPTS